MIFFNLFAVRHLLSPKVMTEKHLITRGKTTPMGETLMNLTGAVVNHRSKNEKTENKSQTIINKNKIGDKN